MAYANNSVHYYSDYGIQPDSIVNSSEVDNIPSILTSEYLPTLEEEGMLFEGWYTTPTFDEGTLAEPGVFAWDKSASLYLYAKWSVVTVSSLLTNLADELRTLTNTTDKMGLSAMAEHVSDANTEVDEQSAVVDELMAALQGKSVPGGAEACTVTMNDPGLLILYTYENVNGAVECRDWRVYESLDGGYDAFFYGAMQNVAKGSLFTLVTADYLDIESCTLTNAEVLLQHEWSTVGGDFLVLRITGNATIALEY